MSTLPAAALDAIASQSLRSLSSLRYVYASLIPAAVADAAHGRGVRLDPADAATIAARVLAALPAAFPGTGGRAGRIARRWERLTAEGREAEAEACFDEAAPL